ncbi:MAG: murein biosynthesis integral membrane protein MurJ [Rubrivivax sp.]|nr:murein biosynthesis integral membrane protein MurJ [Rubrivivax sp.]MDH5340151.1 murein biosynthesis integral membrane protein MurJ [Rubrivivax sp.]
MNLLKSASTVSLLTLASRVTGLVREQMIAAAFGAGATTDAFNVAFRIPNLFRRLFAEGAFAQAFVPVLASTREAEGDAATQSLIDAVASVLTWALAAICAAGVLGAPWLVWAMGSGLERMDTAVLLTRFMFPYIGFMSLVALSAGILNTWRRFAVPAVTPVLLNLSFIAAAWFGVPWFERRGLDPILALAAGVMVGGALQLLVQWPALRAVGRLPRIAITPSKLRAAWRHPGLARVLRQMTPALLGVSVAQISLLINTQIASHVGVGAVSWLTYADRLMEFPTALLGVAMGAVLLPQLSAARGAADTRAYSAMLDWGLRLVLALAAPCAVALLVFPQALVAVLFHYGAFEVRDVAQTARALQGYGVGLLGLVGLKVLAPGFYAREDVRTPMRVGVAALVLTQLMNLVLVPQLGHAGLALSIGLAALFNAGMLLGLLRQRGQYQPAAGWYGFAARVALGCAALGALLAGAGRMLDWIALQAEPWLRAGWMAVVLGGAALLYFAVLHLSGLRLGQFVHRA